MSGPIISKPENLNIQDFNYPLPEENIAQFPAEKRGQSRLLLAHQQPFSISDFSALQNFIPHNSLLIFNETKVIPARLVFAKPTGARIEIFLLQPENGTDYQLSLAETGSSSWQVLIGNASKWKDGDLSISFHSPELGSGELKATRTFADRVRFEWTPAALTFSEILDHLARVPLPPYIHRDSCNEDRDRYQTVYAKHEGSVAAPTAGLHFTEAQLKEMNDCGIQQVALTLHVGLGTFRPVKGSIHAHEMHNEPFYISQQQLQMLAQNADRPWVVVGTTTLRALESLYLFAEKSSLGKCEATAEFSISQWDKWNGANAMSRKVAFETLLRISEKENSSLHGNTSLFIVDGKPLHTANFLITNFHQPKSTLLMLVDAFASENWKQAYDFAIKNKMRFLSYGDACLFKNKVL